MVNSSSDATSREYRVVYHIHATTIALELFLDGVSLTCSQPMFFFFLYFPFFFPTKKIQFANIQYTPSELRVVNTWFLLVHATRETSGEPLNQVIKRPYMASIRDVYVISALVRISMSVVIFFAGFKTVFV